MKKLFVIIALLSFVGTALAQEATPLRMKRFTAALTKQNQYQGWLYTPLFIASQTDTSEAFMWNSDVRSDTLLQAYVTSTGTLTRIAMKIQWGYGSGGNNWDRVGVWSTDSLTSSSGTGSAGTIVARQLGFAVPAGATSLRIITATGAAGNTLTATYEAGVITRPKQTLKRVK